MAENDTCAPDVDPDAEETVESGAGKQQNRKGKTAQKELDNRIALVGRLLCQGKPKSEIKRLLAQMFDVSGRTVERYLVAARGILREGLNKSRNELIEESYGFLCDIKGSDKATIREKLEADKQIRHMLGLNAPVRIAQTDTLGNDIPDDKRSALAGIVDFIREATSAKTGEGDSGS